MLNKSNGISGWRARTDLTQSLRFRMISQPVLIIPPSPIPYPAFGQLTSRVQLFHWSWASLATYCEVLTYQGISESPEQHYLVDQLCRYLSHPATGIERFTQMGPAWKNVVQAVASSAPLTKHTSGIEEVVRSWIAEERDLCLHMTSRLNRSVSAKIERRHLGDQKLRLEDNITSLVKTQTLKSVLRVPDCASDITIQADSRAAAISVSMTDKARDDRKSTRARVNWLLAMLKKDDPRLRVHAYWPGALLPLRNAWRYCAKTQRGFRQKTVLVAPVV